MNWDWLKKLAGKPNKEALQPAIKFAKVAIQQNTQPVQRQIQNVQRIAPVVNRTVVTPAVNTVKQAPKFVYNNIVKEPLSSALTFGKYVTPQGHLYMGYKAMQDKTPNLNFGQKIVKEIGSTTPYEKMNNVKFNPKSANPIDIVQDPASRGFIASTAELPLWAYGGSGVSKALSKGVSVGAKLAGGALAGAEPGAIQGITQTFKEGNIKNIPKNVAQGAIVGGALGATGAGIGVGLQSLNSKNLYGSFRIPTGQGDHGPIYGQLSGTGEKAKNHLLKIRTGEVPNAISKKGIGGIDYLYGQEGKTGYGLGHVKTEHPETIPLLESVIRDGNIVSKTKNRVILETPNHKAAVRLDWDKNEKTWLLTSYDIKKGPGVISRTDSNNITGGKTTPLTSSNNNIVSQDAKNVKQSLGKNGEVLGFYEIKPIIKKTPSNRVNISDNREGVFSEKASLTGTKPGQLESTLSKDIISQPSLKVKGNTPNVAKTNLIKKPIANVNTGMISETTDDLLNKNVASRSMAELTGQKSPLLADSSTTKIAQQKGSPVSLPLKGASQNNLKNVPSLETPNNIIPQNDPVSKVIEAITGAKPIRNAQEAIYSKERSKRVAQMVQAGKVGGEKGFYTQLSKLKGELPKVQFESIRKNLKQEDVDGLYDLVEKAKILPFEKITAKTGLSKLLGAEGGAVPNRSELKLLAEIFPKDFIEAVLNKRPFMEKMWGGVENALNLPRAMMATADLSAPLRQGVLMIGRPKQFGPAVKDMFKFAFSQKAYDNFADSVKLRGSYPAMRQSGLSLTDMGPQLNSREEQFMSNLAEKIPVFGHLAKGSDRAYSGFLNKLRADVFDDLYYKAKDLGIADDKVVKDIAKFVNTATGRGELGKIGKIDLNDASSLLNATFFSPRLMSSRINTLNPLYYVKLDPFVRKEALKSLMAFGGAAATIVGLSKLAGADVKTDPRSADFGKIKIGDTRYDPWGGFQQYIVLGSRLATGEMVSSTTGREFKLGEGYKPTTRWDIAQRFFESKESPIASFITSLVKGKTNMGEDVNIPAEVIDRFIPMIIQDATDLFKEYGAKGIPMAVPGMFGVGSQTYTDQIPFKAKTPTGRETIRWRSAPGLGEAIVNKVTGTNVTDIPEAEQQKLRDERQKETERKIEIDKLKSRVLETGKTEKYDGTIIYLDNGVVKTKKAPSLKLSSTTKTKKSTKKKKTTSAQKSTKKAKTALTPRMKMGKVAKSKAPSLPKFKSKKYKLAKAKIIKPKKLKSLRIS